MIKITPTINRAPDDVTGGGAQVSAQPDMQPPVADAPTAAAKEDQQYRGLVEKNKELLDEVKTAKKQLGSLLDELGGEDGLNEVRELRKRAADNEEFALMKEGRTDVLRERWVKQTQKEYERKLNHLQAALQEKDQKIVERDSRLHREIIGNQVRSAASKIKEFAQTAEDDAVIIALRIFTLGEDGQPVGKDENGVELYGRDGKPMSIREWLESQVDVRPHWFYADGGMGMRPMGALQGAIKMSRAEARTNPIAWAEERRKAEKSGREVVIID